MVLTAVILLFYSIIICDKLNTCDLVYHGSNILINRMNNPQFDIRHFHRGCTLYMYFVHCLIKDQSKLLYITRYCAALMQPIDCNICSYIYFFFIFFTNYE